MSNSSPKSGCKATVGSEKQVNWVQIGTSKICNEDLKGLQEGPTRLTRRASKVSKEDLEGLQEGPQRNSKEDT